MGAGALPGRKPGTFAFGASLRTALSRAASRRSGSTSMVRTTCASGIRSEETFTLRQPSIDGDGPDKMDGRWWRPFLLGAVVVDGSIAGCPLTTGHGLLCPTGSGRG